MSKQTKQETIREFISDIENLMDKINNNSAINSDYHNIKEMYLMVGIDEPTIDNIYNGCGFNDHIDFLTQRNKPKFAQTGNVSCSISKLNGLSEAVIEVLNCEIAKDMSKC